jgi:hypothetical protein
MKIAHILANLAKFPVLEIKEDGWDPLSWDPLYILQAIYGRALGFEDHDREARTVCNRIKGLEIRTVFDFEHESDEDCYVRVVSYLGEAFALVHKFGDRADIKASIIHPETFKALGKQMALAFSEMRLQQELDELENASATPVTALSELNNGYLTWQSEELGAFSFDNPEATYCRGYVFLQLHKAYDGVVQLDDGSLHQVAELMSFCGEQNSDKAALVRVKTREGLELRVAANRIVFFLLKPEDALQSAQYLLPQKTHWRVSGVLTRCVVRITQFREGHLGATSETHVIHNEGVLRKFVADFGTSLNDGVFDATGRDFEKLRV